MCDSAFMSEFPCDMASWIQKNLKNSESVEVSNSSSNIENLTSESVSPNSQTNFSQLECLAFLFGHIIVDKTNVPILQNSFNGYQIPEDDKTAETKSTNDEIKKYSHTTEQILSLPVYQNEKQKFEIFKVGNLDHMSVISKRAFSEGSVVGIFTGKYVEFKANVEIPKYNKDMSLEIILNSKIVGVIDGEEVEDNWVKYMSKARNTCEQNVEAIYNAKNKTFIFVAIRNIMENEELFVWYPSHVWYSYLYNNDNNNQSSLDSNITSTSLNDSEPSITTNNAGVSGYECKKCKYLFSTAKYFEKHLKYTKCSEDPSRIYKCPKCNRKFQKKDRLAVHVRQVHDKIKPYSCTKCHREFSQSSSLTKHIRIHTGERPYHCTYCSKSFTASSILTTHIRQHTGEKPFRCQSCGMDFASHAAYRNHGRKGERCKYRRNTEVSRISQNKREVETDL